MPDDKGNFKPITVPRVPWHEEDEKPKPKPTDKWVGPPGMEYPVEDEE